jgi:flagellar motor switch protein FliN/FliY
MEDTIEPLGDLPDLEPDAEPASAAAPSAPRAAAGPASPPRYETILSIPVTVQVVLGGTTMPVSSLMKLGRGAVVSLDQKVGDPVNVVVNGRIIARGEVVVVDEETARYGVSLTEIVAAPRDDRAA